MSAIVRLVCAPDQAELVADVLWGTGTTGVAEQGTDDGQVEVLAGFDIDGGPAAAAALRSRVHAAFANVGFAGIEVTMLDRAKLDHANGPGATWRSYADAHLIGPFFLRLPEHSPDPTAEVDLVIEPGEAFGAGTHESTRLALEALADLEVLDARVADVGTGTGVLAIAAAHRGASAVEAVDIDAEAVRVATHNVAVHGVADLVSVTLGSIEVVEGTFDVVLANLTAGVQAELCAPITNVLRPGGALVLSGLLRDQVDRVAALYSALSITAHHHEAAWSAITLRFCDA